MVDLSDGKKVRDWNLEFLNQNQETEVVNGVVYLPERDSFLVTGKNFQNIFELKLDYKNY